MTIEELYTLLSDKDFKDPATGNLFFPAYMYTYDPEKELEVDAEITSIKERLHRPNTYVDVLVMDVFEEILACLKAQSLLGNNKLDFYLEKEPENPEAVIKDVKEVAYSDALMKQLSSKIEAHLQSAGEYEKAYVFLKGFGRAYPFLRVSRFMSNFEQYVKGYKLIMFYPGEKKGSAYHMFKLLQDDHLYRAIPLINEES